MLVWTLWTTYVVFQCWSILDFPAGYSVMLFCFSCCKRNCCNVLSSCIIWLCSNLFLLLVFSGFTPPLYSLLRRCKNPGKLIILSVRLFMQLSLLLCSLSEMAVTLSFLLIFIILKGQLQGHVTIFTCAVFTLLMV